MESEKCCICLMSEKDEICYGKFIKKDNIGVHYFCLLSASFIEQKGKIKMCFKCTFYINFGLKFNT